LTKGNIRNKLININRIAVVFCCISCNCVKRDIQKILKKIEQNLENLDQSFLSEEEIEELAKRSKFIQRYGGKIRAKDFLEIMVFNDNNLKSQSLNDLSIAFMKDHNIHLRKQSIDERINDKSVGFIKQVLEEVLKRQIKIEAKEFRHFNRLLIKDSTSFQVDESLFEVYPGSGGGGSSAAVRFQFEFDYLNGGIWDLSLHAFNDQDAIDSRRTLERIREKDLILRDLGYMNLKILQAIESKGAYYLSRLNVSTKVYERKGNSYQEISFKVLKKSMLEEGTTVKELEVYAGNQKLKSRLVIYLLPEAIYQKRLHRQKEINQKKQRGPVNQQVKARAHFNLFLTNTKETQISKEQIWSLYRLRWQIELVFKVWKSWVELDKIKKVKKARLELYFYSKLLLIILGWQVIWQISNWLYRYERKALSIIKSYKSITKKLVKQGLAILTKADCLKDVLLEFYQLSREYHLLERHGKEPSSFEIFMNLGIIIG